MAPTPIRLGTIGAGLAVRVLHWPALKRLPEQFTITQICDVDPAAAAETATLLGGAPTTTDYREVLNNPQVEAVLISLPIHLNAEMILAAARAGKHVICEKPLAGSLDQGRVLARALEGTTPVVAIAENYHFRPDLVQARAWIDEGRIGEVFLITADGMYWSDATKSFASTPWRQDAQYRGSVLADAAVHHAAGLRQLGGEVEQLQAFYKDVHTVMKGPDTLVCNLRFRNGALGSLVFSGATKAAGRDFQHFVAYGTEGTISVDRNEARLIRATEKDGNEQEVVETCKPPDHGGGGYYEEFMDFYEAVRNGRPPRVPVAEALRDWEIIMLALDSAESRSVILL
ncbi:MAG TPA: Gfo/Idh/MocA family oxidoreductase [Chloroflexia bacterium]|nr:Gfo/Idh/MocA family oxidoreductase [Chloroflexia bacterium]